MKKTIITFAAALLLATTLSAATSEKPSGVLVEAESFTSKGGWSVDQQFMDQMGSPYLLAHGLGVRVADAETEIELPATGTYTVWVRTSNWTSPWSKKEGPGAFKLRIAGKTLKTTLGNKGAGWLWQKAGTVRLQKGETTLALCDQSGFDGRCDAVYLTMNQDEVPPCELSELAEWRHSLSSYTVSASDYDFVVVGGGVAGMCAAVSAAREGAGKVALIHDRPVLGGNNSSEVRVHLSGYSEIGRYPNLGKMIQEFGHTISGNAQPASNYEDARKADFIAGEENVTLYAPYHLVEVTMDETGSKIKSVTAVHIETGDRITLSAPIFADCTGDGTLGYLAGAHYRIGREAASEFGENLAPETADSMMMGASVQWYSVKDDSAPNFPEFNYDSPFNESNAEKVNFGEWKWEIGLDHNQISEAEYIRDYGLYVVYSNWSFLKNHYSNKENFKNRRLDWVAYIAGKRESRRLVGDYILKQDDIDKDVFHEDASFTTSWAIDLHFKDKTNSERFPGAEFKAATIHNWIKPYGVPYRCLYSRNVENLFMAGRNISVTHVALGTVRVMRTTAMMGEVVGMAASICAQQHCTPRQVYIYHLDSLKSLMEIGAQKESDMHYPQKFNFPNKILREPAGISGHR